LLEAAALWGKPQARVLDIGCNDGTLLSFYPSEFQKFGVDPSDVAQEITGDVAVVQDIFPSEELIKRLQGQQCDIITSIAMFYDLESPIEFSKEIKNILSPDGIWIFEMSYMPTMLNMNSYDTICHEHLEYYSLAVIEYILKQAGMKIFNVSQNNINGGSLRCYATRIENFKYRKDEFIDNIKAMHQKEFDMELDTDKTYKNFQDRINLHKEELTSGTSKK
jgi:SAM-dependent methyltransferase